MQYQNVTYKQQKKFDYIFMLTDSSSSIILLRSYSAQAGSNMADAMVAISNNKRK